MELRIDVPAYSSEVGVRLEWERGFIIDVEVISGEVVVRANRPGLVSLARHLLHLAGEDVAVGTHMHLDRNASLEETSCAVIIERAFD
jgi:hypothetical protein